MIKEGLSEYTASSIAEKSTGSQVESFGHPHVRAVVGRCLYAASEESYGRCVTTSRVVIKVPDAIGVAVTDEALTVELNDGRAISVPLAWSPRLLHAAPEERGNWRLIGKGQGIHWDALDGDISVEGLLAGRQSGESQASLKRWLARRIQG